MSEDGVWSILRGLAFKVEDHMGEITFEECSAVKVQFRIPKAHNFVDRGLQRFWEEVLNVLIFADFLSLYKAMKKFLTFTDREVHANYLYTSPIMLDLALLGYDRTSHLVGFLRDICGVSYNILEYPEELPEALDPSKKFEIINWDPDDHKGSVANLPSPGKWSRRTSSSVIHVVLEQLQSTGTHLPSKKEMHICEKSEEVPFLIVYYWEGNFGRFGQISEGDIVLLYPTDGYEGDGSGAGGSTSVLEWLGGMKESVPTSFEIYGVNQGRHVIEYESAFSADMGSDDLLFYMTNDSQQPFTPTFIAGNLTIKSAQYDGVVNIKGGAGCNMCLFNCFVDSSPSYQPAVVFAPSRGLSNFHMRRCVVTCARDTAISLGTPRTNQDAGKIKVSIDNCKIRKSGRGYKTRSGESPAVQILNASSVTFTNCRICDNAGHAVQYKNEKYTSTKVNFHQMVFKRNRACWKSGKSDCCHKCPPSIMSVSKTPFKKGRYCFICKRPTNKVCRHCRNVMLCGSSCLKVLWADHNHKLFCVSSP